jgi:hypothetical protein
MSNQHPRSETGALGQHSLWLSERRENVFSQDGEDGIIAAILDLLPDCDKWCAEVGAYDGVSLSNTRNLILSREYSAVLVEADRELARRLCANYEGNERVMSRHAAAGFTEKDNLDVMFSDTAIPPNFDFLSIDIDGNDLHVWSAMRKYSPKVVVIEFNPTIPSAVSFTQPADPSISQGSSLRAMVDLGRDKGYQLVCVTGVNAFFVQEKYFPLFGIGDNSIETLQTNLWAMTYLFSGYDGTIFLRGARRLPWLELKLNEARMQVVPRWFRAPRGSYTRLKHLAFRFWKDPLDLAKSVQQSALRKLFRKR